MTAVTRIKEVLAETESPFCLVRLRGSLALSFRALCLQRLPPFFVMIFFHQRIVSGPFATDGHSLLPLFIVNITTNSNPEFQGYIGPQMFANRLIDNQ